MHDNHDGVNTTAHRFSLTELRAVTSGEASGELLDEHLMAMQEVVESKKRLAALRAEEREEKREEKLRKLHEEREACGQRSNS